MRTGEAPALTKQGEADSLQSGACSGCAAQGASPQVLRPKQLPIMRGKWII